MERAFTQQTKHGIMGGGGGGDGDDDDDDHLLDEQDDDIGSLSSSSASEEEEEADDDDDEVSSNSVESSSSDFMEGSSSSASSSNGPLFEMSSLISHLPIKRGLSKHFEGKSQSFTSLTNVQSLEDLIKPERPIKKSKQLLRSSKSYGWGLDKPLSPKNSITKRSSSKGSFSSLSNMRRHSSHNSFRAPCPTPQRLGSLSRHTVLETIG